MPASAVETRGRSPLRFFLLVFALSVPFWWIGAITGLQLMPGLSVSALAAFSPTAAALILLCRTNKTAGVTDLLWRSFDFKRIRSTRWFAPILLLMPCVSPVYGSHFDMRLGGLVMAFMAAGVVVLWGPNTLARRRPHRSHETP